MRLPTPRTGRRPRSALFQPPLTRVAAGDDEPATCRRTLSTPDLHDLDTGFPPPCRSAGLRPWSPRQRRRQCRQAASKLWITPSVGEPYPGAEANPALPDAALGCRQIERGRWRLIPPAGRRRNRPLCLPGRAQAVPRRFPAACRALLPPFRSASDCTTGHEPRRRASPSEGVRF
jgi:hypothetical protein